MEKTVFISHSTKDVGLARSILVALEKRGIQCWTANRDIEPGENFQRSIFRAIRAARIMLVIMTENANSSSEILKEIAIAGQFHCTVIPVRLEEIVLSEALAYEFATRQWIDLCHNRDEGIERLVSWINKILLQPTTLVPEQTLASAAGAPKSKTVRRQSLPIRVPTLGENVEEATVGKWFKKVGDVVSIDEPVIELETDKVTIEIPSPASGKLIQIVAGDGANVRVGSLLGVVEQER